MEGAGPWFPEVFEHETSHEFEFAAGRWHERPDLKQPAHFPDGGWLALGFDAQKDELLLRSDPFLQYRWYYAELDGVRYFCPSLRGLVEAMDNRATIDWNMAPYMLRFGYLPYDRTPLAEVRSVRSGETLHCLPEQNKIERADLLPPRREPRDVPASEIHDALREAVVRDIGSRERIIVPISGGMDSRVLLGLALKFLPRDAIQTLTFGYPGSLDFQIGTRVARELGVRNIALHMDPRALSDMAAENFAYGEGMYWSAPEYPVRPLLEALPERSLILSGYIGDLVFGSYEEETEPASAVAARDLLFEAVALLSAEAVLRLLPGSKTGYDELVRTLPRPVELYEASIYHSHLMNRTNFSLFVHQQKCCYATPFVQANVLKLAYQLPPERRLNEIAFFEMVKEYLPELWKLPLKSSFGYPPEFMQSKRAVLLRGMRKALQKTDEVLGPKLGTILYRHPRLNYAHPREWLAPPHRAFVVECIERLILHSPLEKKELVRLRDRINRGGVIEMDLLKSLVTLGQWVQYYGARK